MRTAYLEGRSVAALARDHGVSRGAIRTAVADLLPEHASEGQEDVPTPELPVTLDMPGKVADFLRAIELEPDERAALDQRVTVRRGQGYTLRVSTTRAVHRQLLARCQPLGGGQGTLPERIAGDTVLGPNSPFRLEYLEPCAEAARTWLHGEAEVIGTTHLTPAQAALRIAEAVKS
ncbi:ATP-binding protein [Streptomyces halstedii]|uniref:ATP-binding protein n=1 Tax=Streptomyces halstedii TaxID=1944 RepID=UPI0036A2E5EC